MYGERMGLSVCVYGVLGVYFSLNMCCSAPVYLKTSSQHLSTPFSNTHSPSSKKDKRKEALKRDGPSDIDPFAPKPPTPPTPVVPAPPPVRASTDSSKENSPSVPEEWDGAKMPQPPTVAPAPAAQSNGRKIYSRDFLLRLCEQNNAMPAGLQPNMDGLQALFDRSGGARDNEGGFGGHRGPGRQHSGRGGFDRADSRGGYGGQDWNRLPRGNSQPPGIVRCGIALIMGGSCNGACCCFLFLIPQNCQP